MQLSQRDLDPLLRAALKLHACRDVETLTRALPDVLRRLKSSKRHLASRLCPHLDLARSNASRRTAQRERLRRLGRNGKLTPREAEIACWLAAGKSNPEIACILHCKRRTVEKHVERILEKLGVENRASVAVVLAQAPDVPSELG